MPVSANATDMYEGSEKYLKAVDLKNGERTLIITDANECSFKNGDRQIALSFAGEVKTLGLNKTNFGTIAFSYGKDPNAWTGRPIVAFATTTSNQSGQIVPCVRLRIPNGQATPAPAPAAPQAPAPPAPTATFKVASVDQTPEQAAWRGKNGVTQVHTVTAGDGTKYGLVVGDGPEEAGKLADLRAAAKLGGTVTATYHETIRGRSIVAIALPEPGSDTGEENIPF